MEDFRSKTFFQFVRTKPTGHFKALLIGAFLTLLVVFIFAYNNRYDVFWIASGFILFILFVQGFFLYALAYRMYWFGRKAYLALPHKNVTILNDVGVFVRGFDLMSKRSFFDIDISKAIYEFDKADLIIGDTSIVLLGKSNRFGASAYASPVEILTSKKETNSASAKILNWTEQRGRIVIDIKDEYYGKPFKIEFKDHIDPIKLWLIKVLPIKK